MTSHAEGTETSLLERIRRIDRQATLERLLSYLAHSLGTPLNVIGGRAAIMTVGSVEDAEVVRNARIIGEQSTRILTFLRQIAASAAAHTSPGKPDDARDVELKADLGVATRTVIAMLAPVAAARGCTIRFDGWKEAANVRLSAETLLVALMHLVENGIRATPFGGTLMVRLRPETSRIGGDDFHEANPLAFCLDVEDEGCGIGPDLLPRLFEPFATPHDDAEGFGLGLFVAQSIARQHGGWVEVFDKSPAGTCFTLHLMRRDQDVQ